ncbi:MAG TPA: hypothetical protein VLT33_26165 [Labilithrix sp.]|nr:hypothetical protein [Labilithrix sp.]
MMHPSESSDQEDTRANARALKVHLREVTVGRYTYRVVTLRPATTARFSTNFFHDTWHVLTDREGAFVLARLLWGLAFQREPGTVVLLDGAHLVPTPFEADPPTPVLIVPAGLTRVDADLLRLLRARIGRPAPSRTARWQTFGLPQALAARDDPMWFHDRWRRQLAQEHMQKLGGLICYSAPPDVLRWQAVSIYRMRSCRNMTYHYLAAERRRGGEAPDGEVQVFRDFRDMVSAAAVARRSVLEAHRSSTPIASDDERDAVQREAGRVDARVRAGRRRKRKNRDSTVVERGRA